MKKVFCMLAALLFPVLLGGCSVEQMSSLRELSKPYLGLYEIKTLTLGGEDIMDTFESIELELGYSGEYELRYADTLGNEGVATGEYRMDVEGNEITMSIRRGSFERQIVAPVEKGNISFDYPYGGKMLHAVFSMP